MAKVFRLGAIVRAALHRIFFTRSNKCCEIMLEGCNMSRKAPDLEILNLIPAAQHPTIPPKP